ncbi:unnamed protein product, partial [Phaeothamnion confervicola]
VSRTADASRSSAAVQRGCGDDSNSSSRGDGIIGRPGASGRGPNRESLDSQGTAAASLSFMLDGSSFIDDSATSSSAAAGSAAPVMRRADEASAGAARNASGGGSGGGGGGDYRSDRRLTADFSTVDALMNGLDASE